MPGDLIGDGPGLFKLEPALISLASVRDSSRSLLSSEFFSVSAASIDFLCMPENERDVSFKSYKVCGQAKGSILRSCRLRD